MKKYILFLVVAVLLSAGSACKKDKTDPITWELNNGTLTISGNGVMPDYYSCVWCGCGSFAPWYEYRDSIHTAIIETSITTIGSGALGDCSNLTSITIPNNIISIGEYAFYSCISLTSITIPNSVTTIGYGAFYNCTNLSSITIHSSVTVIDEYAFWRCTSLASITSLNPVPVAIDSNVFKDVNQSACTLKVPTSSVSAYKNAPVWKEFNIVGI